MGQDICNLPEYSSAIPGVPPWLSLCLAVPTISNLGKSVLLVTSTDLLARSAEVLATASFGFSLTAISSAALNWKVLALQEY